MKLLTSVKRNDLSSIVDMRVPMHALGPAENVRRLEYSPGREVADSGRLSQRSGLDGE